MAPSELPNTFLIPISLVLDRATKRVRPNKPKAAINKAKSAAMDRMVLKFFSAE